ncbi:MAG: DNA polymerase III subunit epsilon [Ghiorsea sp.]|nr:DNA polymerase III subunit epsilon [Ghiorsea sp.]
MRYIMLDTETTGLSTKKGARIVEIGAVEVDERGQEIGRFHHYINPQCAIPQQVVRIHGIDDEMVKDKPIFSDIAQDFLSFIAGATLVIHNAPFDLSFIEHELALCHQPCIATIPVVDTLALARKHFPKQRNTLDALCERFDIDRGHRQLHGALLDAQLLAEVYAVMIECENREG